MVRIQTHHLNESGDLDRHSSMVVTVEQYCDVILQKAYHYAKL